MAGRATPAVVHALPALVRSADPQSIGLDLGRGDPASVDDVADHGCGEVRCNPDHVWVNGQVPDWKFVREGEQKNVLLVVPVPWAEALVPVIAHVFRLRFGTEGSLQVITAKPVV
jgi:hypothetical protein